MALNRTLRLPMLTFYGTGMILGAGIYSIIGQAAGIAKPGAFRFTKDLPSSIAVAAIWISVDGDDTGSEFETIIAGLELKVIR